MEILVQKKPGAEMTKENEFDKTNQRILGVGFRNAQCIKNQKNKLNSKINKSIVQNIQYGLFKTSCIYTKLLLYWRKRRIYYAMLRM